MLYEDFITKLLDMEHMEMKNMVLQQKLWKGLRTEGKDKYLIKVKK